MNKIAERSRIAAEFNNCLFKIINQAITRRPKDHVLLTLRGRVDLVRSGSESLIIEQVGPILIKYSTQISKSDPELFTKDLIKKEITVQLRGVPDVAGVEKFAMEVFDVVKGEVKTMKSPEIKQVFNEVNGMLLLYIDYLEMSQ
jgi:hypothetical protein